MASFIRPNRSEVSRTFPWLGFTIRAGAAPAWFEVAITTDPNLFDSEAKSRRTAETFYSTRAAGPLPAPSGEAVWIVPPAVLARFAGTPKLYYALATFRSADRQGLEIVRVPAAAAPSVALSRSFTGVTRRLAGVGGRAGDSGPEFGSSAASPSLEWAGDTALVTPTQPVAGAPAHASALEFEYSDGFGVLPPESLAVHDRHRYPAQALGDAVDIYWDDVELVAQPTNVSCWAAAAAMVVGWRDRVSINPDEFARLEGRWAEYNRRGLSTDNNAEFAAAWRLEVEPPMDPSVEFFGRLLQTKGPLWIGRHPSLNPVGMGHAVAVIGLNGDGTPDGTFVHWHDPSPPGRGTANRSESYTTFLQEFDDFMTVDAQGHVNNQILHAADTGGRTPGDVPRASGQSLALVHPFTFDSPPVTRTTQNVGDISMVLENWDGMRYPPGVSGGAAAPTPKQITIEGPRYNAFGVDAIYANIDLDFQYDGRGVGKVAMRMGEHSDAVSKGLNVTAHVVDDARTFQGPSGQTFGAIRITIDYAMTQVVADDVMAHIDVMLYGSGDYDVRYHMAQGSFDHMPSDVVSGVRPATAPARAQAIALGTFDSPPVTRSTETSGDLTMNLESWDGMKYPSGVSGGTAAANAKHFAIEGPRYAALGIDNIYANIDVDFQYDGRGVGKVAMRMGEHSDAITKGLNVTAHIVDDARTFQGPSGQTFAGIRITIDYAMTQVIADDVQAQIDVMLYGSGDYDVRYHMVQGSFDHLPSDVISGVRAASTPAHAQAIAMEGEGAGAAAGAAGQAVGSIAGVVVQQIIENVGDLTIAHESWNGMRYPAGVTRGNTATTPKQITIPGPRYNAFYVDAIFCDLTVDFEYDGRGVGKVATRAGARSDAVGKGLRVQAHIVDDARTFTGGSGGTQTFAGVRITLEYSFTQVVADDIVVHAEAMLYGNGDYDLHYHLVQGEVDHMPAEVNSGVVPTSQPAVPQPASLGTEDVLTKIGSFIVAHFDPTADGIDGSLDQWPRADQRGGPSARKYPFDDPQQAGEGATQHKQLAIECPHSTSGNFCDLLVSWDFNGRWLTNVDITSGHAHGVPFLERLDYKYKVTAKVEDVPGGFVNPQTNDPPCAALRINIEWREVRPVRENTLLLCSVLIFGNGGYELNYSLESGEVEDPSKAINYIAQPPMRSVGRTAQAHSLEAAPASTATTVTRSSETRGAVRFELDQYQGMKQPPGFLTGAQPIQTTKVPLAGPRASAPPGIDETYGDCEIAYDYDGRSLGNVHVRPTTTAGTAPLAVVESLTDDPQVYAMPGSTDPLAALKLTFEYRFDSSRPLTTEVVLYGNGRQDVHYSWAQG